MSCLLFIRPGKVSDLGAAGPRQLCRSVSVDGHPDPQEGVPSGLSPDTLRMRAWPGCQSLVASLPLASALWTLQVCLKRHRLFDVELLADLAVVNQRLQQAMHCHAFPCALLARRRSSAGGPQQLILPKAAGGTVGMLST